MCVVDSEEEVLLYGKRFMRFCRVNPKYNERISTFVGCRNRPRQQLIDRTAP
jgi:hypothetical protein